MVNGDLVKFLIETKCVDPAWIWTWDPQNVEQALYHYATQLSMWTVKYIAYLDVSTLKLSFWNFKSPRASEINERHWKKSFCVTTLSTPSIWNKWQQITNEPVVSGEAPATGTGNIVKGICSAERAKLRGPYAISYNIGQQSARVPPIIMTIGEHHNPRTRQCVLSKQRRDIRKSGRCGGGGNSWMLVDLVLSVGVVWKYNSRYKCEFLEK